MRWEVKRVRPVKNIAISSETEYPSRVWHRKPPLTMTFSQYKASQQKSQIYFLWGPGSQASTGEGSRKKNCCEKQDWGLWNNSLLFSYCLKHLAPFSTWDGTHLNSSTNAAELYEFVGASRGDISDCFITPAVCHPDSHLLCLHLHTELYLTDKMLASVQPASK